MAKWWQTENKMVADKRVGSIKKAFQKVFKRATGSKKILITEWKEQYYFVV